MQIFLQLNPGVRAVEGLLWGAHVVCLHLGTSTHTSKWHDNSPLNTFANKSERTLPNDILAQGRGHYRIQLAVNFSSVFTFISPWYAHIMTLHELTGYKWKSWCVTCNLPWTMLQRTQVLMTSHPLILFYTYTFMFYVWQNLSPLLYRWGVAAVVFQCVHWTMWNGILQNWITPLSPAIVMFSLNFWMGGWSRSRPEFYVLSQMPTGWQTF